MTGLQWLDSNFGKWSASWQLATHADKKRLLLGLLVYFILLLFYFNWQSQGCDESGYFSYALRWAKGHPERLQMLDDSKTPMVFPVLWSFVLKPFIPTLQANYGEGFLLLGRAGMFVYPVFMALILFFWLLRLMGPKTWLWVWSLCLLDPLMIGHSLLVGSDMASATCWLATAYFSWRLATTLHRKYLVLLGLSWGIGLAVKSSMVYLLPMSLMVILLTRFFLPGFIFRTIPFKRMAGAFLLMIALMLLTVNTAYRFSGFGKPLKSIEAKSQLLADFQQQYRGISSIPLPISVHVVTSFDWLLRNAEAGGGYSDEHSYPPVFINGKSKQSGGFPEYYVVQFLYKTTPLLLLALAGSMVLITIQKKWRAILKRHAALWLPPLFFMAILSFSNPFQIGIRHALPVWPFLYLATVPAISWILNRSLPILTILCVLQFADLVLQWPNLLAYTPPWMQPKHLLYKRINDSSIEYCTDEKIYLHFLKTHPEYQPLPPQPAAGFFAVRMSHCNPGPPGKQKPHCWISRYFEPSGHYKTSILLYHITPQQLKAIEENL